MINAIPTVRCWYCLDSQTIDLRKKIPLPSYQAHGCSHWAAKNNNRNYKTWVADLKSILKQIVFLLPVLLCLNSVLSYYYYCSMEGCTQYVNCLYACSQIKHICLKCVDRVHDIPEKPIPKCNVSNLHFQGNTKWTLWNVYISFESHCLKYK